MRTEPAGYEKHGLNGSKLEPIQWDRLHLLSINKTEIESADLEKDVASGTMYQSPDRLRHQETPRPVALVTLSRDYARSCHTCDIVGDAWRGVLQINGGDGLYCFVSHTGEEVQIKFENTISMTRLEESRSPENVVMVGHEQVRGFVDRSLWPEVFSLYANNKLIADAIVGYYGPRFRQRAGWDFFRRQLTRSVMNRSISNQCLVYSRLGESSTASLSMLAAAYAMLLRNVVWPGVPHSDS